MQEEIADGPGKANAETSNRIRIIHGELLAQPDLDAIVSFLTEDLSWGGPVNQKILAMTDHKADEYVLNHIPRIRKGDAFSTPAFGLPSKCLIFAVISKWDCNFSGGERFLKLSIMKALRIAAHLGCQRIGIPALSAGPDKFPLRKGARIIFNALRDSRVEDFETVEIVCKSQDAYQAYRERFA